MSMVYRATKSRRHGAIVLECAFVYPIVFLLIFGLIVAGLGVYLSTTLLPGSPRRGTVAVFVAACLTVLVGILAITLDGGLLLNESRHAQVVADAAALAAATDLMANAPLNGGTDPSGTAKASALTTAAANGYSNDGTTSVVTVNIPPQTGHNIGNPGFAE